MNPPIDISDVTLKTERLLLRPWKLTDLNDFNAYASVDGVGQMAGWKPHESLEESRKILEMFIKEKKTFAVELQGKAIGSVGIERYHEEMFPAFDGKKCREIGYVLSKAYWGRGFMPEAVREVIRWLFEEVRLDIILSGHFLWNAQSRRVLEKCGFTHYAYRQYTTLMNTVEDDDIRILTKEDRNIITQRKDNVQ